MFGGDLSTALRKRFPRTITELRLYITEEWDKLEPADYLHCIEEMPDRCEAVIKAKGGHTKW